MASDHRTGRRALPDGLLALALALALVACQDLGERDFLSALAANPPAADDDGGNGGGGDGGGTGACDNEADLPILRASATHPTSLAIGCVLGGCGVDRTCIEGCLVQHTEQTVGAGLSRDCARCFADASRCAFQDCGSTCGLDVGTQDCAACYVERCLPDYCDCIGEGLDTDCERLE
jgi:hypothetical protein